MQGNSRCGSVGTSVLSQMVLNMKMCSQSNGLVRFTEFTGTSANCTWGGVWDYVRLRLVGRWGRVGWRGVGGVGPGRTPRVPGWTTYVMQVSIHTQSPAVTIHGLGKSTYAWFLYPLFCEVYICIYVYVRIYTYVYVYVYTCIVQQSILWLGQQLSLAKISTF